MPYISVNDLQQARLDALVQTGLYGVSEGEVCEALFNEGMRHAVEARFIPLKPEAAQAGAVAAEPAPAGAVAGELASGAPVPF